MLRISKYETIKKEIIEFDIYIPIDVKFGIWDISKEPTIYWRTGDFSDSLIEIGLGKYKKDIRSITLIMCKNIYEIDNYNKKEIDIVNGSPILEIHNINGEIYIDEKGPLKVYIESESVSIIFSDNKINNCLKNGNVDFYLNTDNFFIGFKINNITEENKNILKKSLEYF